MWPRLGFQLDLVAELLQATDEIVGDGFAFPLIKVIGTQVSIRFCRVNM